MNETKNEVTIVELPVDKIDQFPKHPYKVKDDNDMIQLVESLRDNGVIVPNYRQSQERRKIRNDLRPQTASGMQIPGPQNHPQRNRRHRQECSNGDDGGQQPGEKQHTSERKSFCLLR